VRSGAVWPHGQPSPPCRYIFIMQKLIIFLLQITLAWFLLALSQKFGAKRSIPIPLAACRWNGGEVSTTRLVPYRGAGGGSCRILCGGAIWRQRLGGWICRRPDAR
jgi:hypothetical protein